MSGLKSKQALVLLVIYTLVIFGTGVLFGQKTQKHQSRLHFVKAMHHSSQERPMRQHRRMMVKKLSHKLKLSQDQRQQLNQIFDKYEPRAKEMHGQMRQQFQETRQQMTQEINAILSPKQQERFQQIQQRMRRRLER